MLNVKSYMYVYRPFIAIKFGFYNRPIEIITHFRKERGRLEMRGREGEVKGREEGEEGREEGEERKRGRVGERGRRETRGREGGKGERGEAFSLFHPLMLLYQCRVM